MITSEDVALFRGMGILVEEGVLAEVPVEEDTGRISAKMAFAESPHGKIKTIPAKAPLILKFVRNAPNSVPVQTLVLTFGEGVLSMLKDMVQEGFLVHWVKEGVDLIYVNPEKAEYVDKLLKYVDKLLKFNQKDED